MSLQINVHEAKTHFSKILKQVEYGEEVVISRAGRPVVKMVAYKQAKNDRKPGRSKQALGLNCDFLNEWGLK